jgi:hypothetical protein
MRVRGDRDDSTVGGIKGAHDNTVEKGVDGFSVDEEDYRRSA